MSDLIPTGDEQAKAVQETAKFLTKALGLVEGAGGYTKQLVGSLPDDLIGLVGDGVRHVRIRNLARLTQRTEEILQERGVNVVDAVSISLAEPLLRSAANEDRTELRELWARLLAAAMNPATATQVRQSFIVTVKQLDPLDARVLALLRNATPPPMANPDAIASMSADLQVPHEEVEVSIESLRSLNCVIQGVYFSLTPYGRVFLNACYP